MTVIFCDICGKMLEEKHTNQVNIEFISYSLGKKYEQGFMLNIRGRKDITKELQVCVECAESIASNIEDLYLIAQNDKEQEEKTAKDGEQDG